MSKFGSDPEGSTLIRYGVPGSILIGALFFFVLLEDCVVIFMGQPATDNVIQRLELTFLLKGYTLVGLVAFLVAASVPIGFFVSQLYYFSWWPGLPSPMRRVPDKMLSNEERAHIETCACSDFASLVDQEIAQHREWAPVRQQVLVRTLRVRYWLKYCATILQHWAVWCSATRFRISRLNKARKFNGAAKLLHDSGHVHHAELLTTVALANRCGVNTAFINWAPPNTDPSNEELKHARRILKGLGMQKTSAWVTYLEYCFVTSMKEARSMPPPDFYEVTEILEEGGFGTELEEMRRITESPKTFLALLSLRRLAVYLNEQAKAGKLQQFRIRESLPSETEQNRAIAALSGKVPSITACFAAESAKLLTNASLIADEIRRQEKREERHPDQRHSAKLRKHYRWIAYTWICYQEADLPERSRINYHGYLFNSLGVTGWALFAAWGIFNILQISLPPHTAGAEIDLYRKLILLALTYCLSGMAAIVLIANRRDVARAQFCQLKTLLLRHCRKTHAAMTTPDQVQLPTAPTP